MRRKIESKQKIQMPENFGDEGDESWTQTLITITPEEDAAIRTITETTVISAIGATPLVLGVSGIAERLTVQINTMRRDLFIETAELEERIGHSNAGCQTFLQGVAKVELPSAFKDEATQTMYLANIYPYTPHPFQHITRIMNDRIMPAAEKITEATQTVLTFQPDVSRNYIVDRLTNGIATKELQENNFAEQTTAASTYVRDNLHFILDRVLWLSDPGYCVPEVKMKDEVAQTCIKYDHGLEKVVLDADTQTSLTCEPRRSNTDLLSEWSAMKEFARDIIDECLETGVHPRAIVYSILDEVVEKCAGQIHLPYRDKNVQTLAPCDALKDKDDEVLRKLRLEVLVDALESSTIVLPLVGILVERACLEIQQYAPTVAAEILHRIQKNSVTIATRLAAIRQEVASYKPMDDIFDARKKRLRKLLQNKAATRLSSGAQTELAGVPDIIKVKEPRETVCSTCVRHSECFVCEASLDNEQVEDIVHGKILRTQDILIAYNPCYVVTTPSEIPKLQPPMEPVASKQPRTLSSAGARASASSSTACEPETERDWTDDVCPAGPRSVKLKGKGGGSCSADSNTILRQVGASSACLSRKPPDRERTRSRCDLSVRSVKALRILKNTFNRNEESCSDCSNDQEKLDVKGSQGGAAGTGSNTSGKTREESEDQHTFKGSRMNEKPYGEGVRVVPIIHLQNQINKQ